MRRDYGEESARAYGMSEHPRARSVSRKLCITAYTLGLECRVRVCITLRRVSGDPGSPRQPRTQ